MADYYHGGGRAMYSNTDECYDAGRHGHGGGMRAYSRTDEYYDNVQDDRMRRPAYYADDDCGGYNGGRQTAVYTDEYSRGGYGGNGGYGGEQEHFKREEREHKHKERLGEVGALAGGAFALVIRFFFFFFAG